MSSAFAVRYTGAAREDLFRLFDFLLQRAATADDFDTAQQAVDTIVEQVETQLSRSPFIFRKAGQSPFVRERVIPFRGGGYVVLYEIDGGDKVNILAVRHQLEDDYH